MPTARTVAHHAAIAAAVAAVLAVTGGVAAFAVQMASMPAAVPPPAPSTEAPVGEEMRVPSVPGDAGVPRPDPEWLERVAASTGIPERALRAYAGAHLALVAEDPGCGIRWNTLAGLGSIESDHGRHGGAVLGEDGYSEPAIRGIPLDGTTTARIPDTDGGAWDGDTEWDRAVGPLQFIPDTWMRWGADADGDGAADPNQIDDAALAAGRYLCASGAMNTAEAWRTAIFSYNHLDVYVDDVAIEANRYAALAGD